MSFYFTVAWREAAAIRRELDARSIPYEVRSLREYYRDEADALAEKAEEAIMEAIAEWKLQLADKAIDSLACKTDASGKTLLQNAEEWKARLRSEPQKVLEDMPWLIFVMVDRATNIKR